MANEFESIANILEKWSTDLDKVYSYEVKIALEDAWENSIEEFKEYAKKRAMEAIEATEEFNENFFIERLMRVFDNKYLYQITLLNFNEETGDYYNIIVRLLMNEFAGSVDNYFRAVEIYREFLESMSTRPKHFRPLTPAQKSSFWKHIYIVGHNQLDENLRGTEHENEYLGNWWMTVLGRAQEYGGAPFWEIIDQGTGIGGHSKGGTPYPEYGPTNFVSEIEFDCKHVFISQFESALEVNAKEIEDDDYGYDDIEYQVEKEFDSPTGGAYHTPNVLEKLATVAKQAFNRVSRFFGRGK